MPCASSRSRMCGTAAADSSLLTVTRTSSEPARASALTCATVPSMSAVSVLVMDCTTMGDAPPMETEPTFTVRECRRFLMPALYRGAPGISRRPREGLSRRPEASLRRDLGRRGEGLDAEFRIHLAGVIKSTVLDDH